MRNAECLMPNAERGMANGGRLRRFAGDGVACGGQEDGQRYGMGHCPETVSCVAPDEVMRHPERTHPA